jgi:predicted nucleic acid-binding protein
MSLGDSIIASTALLLSESILTNNTIDFFNIVNIKLIDLKEII